ncbi:MAG: hypothetical protein JXA82_02795 [Sedimentisphaerales bacterium]|nr:hypothetical protein [Sedimentisphaerales bacterium]
MTARIGYTTGGSTALVRRRYGLPDQLRQEKNNPGRGPIMPHVQNRTRAAVEAFTVEVNRKFYGSTARLLRGLGIYTQFDHAPLGLIVDYYA